MRGKTLRAIGASAVLAGIAAIAIAQGRVPEAPTEIAAPSTTAQAIATTTPPSAVQPFQYRIGLLSGPSTDNFWTYLGEEPTAWNSYTLGLTKPSLYGIDPSTQDLTSDLAGDATPSVPHRAGGAWQIDIELRADAAWSDGEPITAHDVVYTFDTVRRLGLGGGWAEGFPSEIVRITAVSPSMLRVELSTEPSLRVWPHGLGLAPIMPAHIWSSKTEGLNDAPELYRLDGAGDVSGGPLLIVRQGDELIEAVPNPAHPGLGVDSIIYSVFADESQAVAAIERGDIDTILDPNGLSEDSITRLDGADDVTLVHSPANSIRYLGFNLTRTPMSDPSFRSSLALLLDKEQLTETLLPGAEPAYTLVSPANQTWFDQDRAAGIANMYTGEIEERLGAALTGLTEAGYTWQTPPSVTDGTLTPGSGLAIQGQQPAPVTILTPGDEYDPIREDYTRQIGATMEAIGFDVRPVVTDFETVVDLAFTTDDAGVRQYDMYLLGWTLGNPARPDFYRPFFAAEGRANSTGYTDPDFAGELDRYEDATKETEARSALWDMEARIAADLPYLSLYHPDLVEVYRSDRVGFTGEDVLGGIQGRLGALGDLIPAS